MRSHGRILVSIWRDKDFVARSVEAQRCYMLLLAQKDVNNAGVQPLMIGKWAKGCGATSEADIVRALNELQAHRFVAYDVETEELLIRSFIRNDGIMKQPNVLKNALRVAGQTESARLRKALADELRTLRRKDAGEVADDLDPGDIGNPYETLPEGFPNPSETLPEPLNPFGRVSKPCGDGDGEGVTRDTNSPFVDGCVSLRAHEPEPAMVPAMVLIPDDWSPNDLHRAKYSRPDLDALADGFRDHAIANGRRCHGRPGWDAAFSTWVRKSPPPTNVGPVTAKTAGWLDIAAQAASLATTDQRAIQ